MLKKYKNKFVEFINEFDFGLIDYNIKFEENIKEEDVNIISQITINITDTPMFFSLRNSEEDWHTFDIKYSSFNPGIPTEYFPKTEWGSFEECLEFLSTWKKEHLDEFIYEKNQPDLLEFLTNKDTRKLSSINFEDKSPFEDDEKKLVIQGLNEIKILIADEFNFNKTQMTVINNRIGYLEESLDRLNKVDWKGILISTIFSIITTLALDIVNSEKLLQLFSKVIQNIPKLNF